jgi:uncharacterized protein
MTMLVLAAAVLLAVGCGGGNDSGTVVLEGEVATTTLAVEVADSDEERHRGLKGREELRPNSGMVFLFDEPVSTRFVMDDTLIPLSIAFVDDAGRIVAIRDMDPCQDDPCPTYGADEPFSAALEVEQGAFRRFGIHVGDRMRVSAGEG